MILYRGIQELLTFERAAQKDGRSPQEEDLSLIKRGAFLVDTFGKILWVGEEKKFSTRLVREIFEKKKSSKETRQISENKKSQKPSRHRQFSNPLPDLKEVDLQTQTVLPGFIECHTHLGFGGSRSQEFEWRMTGVSYQEIYEKGGGIQSTVKATRSVSPAELQKLVEERAQSFLRQGVTYFEAKSGYGLDLKTELKLLKSYKTLKSPRVVTTYLGLHAKSPDFESQDKYLEYVIDVVLPRVAKEKLADRVDVFVEKGYYTPEQAERYFQRARDLGLDCVVHADQLTLSGGSSLAINEKCLSADHLIQIKESEIRGLAQSDVTCVLLPAADLYMKCAYPPARALLDQGARVALATDFNPGSSPTQNLNLVGLLARLEMKMKLHEVLVAYTVGAAHALKVHPLVGSLTVGRDADFICTQKSWRELFYQVGDQDIHAVFSRGRKKWASKTN